MKYYFFVVENQKTKVKESGIFRWGEAKEGYETLEDTLKEDEVIIEFHAVV